LLPTVFGSVQQRILLVHKAHKVQLDHKVLQVLKALKVQLAQQVQQVLKV
jgi:hypothetical protein